MIDNFWGEQAGIIRTIPDKQVMILIGEIAKIRRENEHEGTV